jgi:hypothetical protein
MSIKTDRDYFFEMLVSSNTSCSYGRRRDLDREILDSNDPQKDDYNYITFDSNDGDVRVEMLFNADGKLVSTKVYK